MAYEDFTTARTCEFCKAQFTVKDSRVSRLCGECLDRKPDIDAVLAGTPYSQATPEQVNRILDRVEQGRTTRRGGMNGFFNPKDPDGRLGIANEYRRKWRKDI